MTQNMKHRGSTILPTTKLKFGTFTTKAKTQLKLHAKHKCYNPRTTVGGQCPAVPPACTDLQPKPAPIAPRDPHPTSMQTGGVKTRNTTGGVIQKALLFTAASYRAFTTKTHRKIQEHTGDIQENSRRFYPHCNIYFDSSVKDLFILCKPRAEDFNHMP